MGRRQTASIGLTVFSALIGLLLWLAASNLSAQNSLAHDSWTADPSVGFAASGGQSPQSSRMNNAVRTALAGGFQNYTVPNQAAATQTPQTPSAPPAQINFDAASTAVPPAAPNFATAPSGSLLPKQRPARSGAITSPTQNRPSRLFPTSTPLPIPAPTAPTAEAPPNVLAPVLPETPSIAGGETVQSPTPIAENSLPLPDLNNIAPFAETDPPNRSAPALLVPAAPNETASIPTAPIQTAPIQTTPIQTTPIQTTAVQTDLASNPPLNAPAANTAAKMPAETLAEIPEAPAEISVTDRNVQNPPVQPPQPPIPTSGVLSGDEPTAAPGIVPPPDGFSMTQEEEKLLNEFLLRWEDFGRHIKRVACDVQVMEQDGGLFLQNNKSEQKRPMSHTYGKFRFIAPNRLLYHVAGEFIYQPGASSDEPFTKEYKKGSGELKFVCDGKSWAEYDFNKRVVNVYPIPEEQWNQDLSMDGPFPLFFIANARNLKNRFYMRIVTPVNYRESQVWIEAFPRLSADAGSFQRIIIILNLADLQPSYMRKFHVNGKSYSELSFREIEINKGFWDIDTKVDFGWKKEVKDETFAITPADSPK